MFDLFATPEARAARDAVRARFSAAEDELYAECQASAAHLSERFALQTARCKETLQTIQNECEELQSFLVRLNDALPAPTSMFRMSPDAAALSRIAHAAHRVRTAKECFSLHISVLIGYVKTSEFPSMDSLQALFFLAAGADAARDSARYPDFQSLLQSSREKAERQKEQRERLLQIIRAWQRFCENDLSKLQVKLAAGADFAHRGEAGDLGALRRTVGEFSYAFSCLCTELQAEIAFFEKP